MKRTCCNTLTILVAGLLLAGPALGNGGPSLSESRTPVDTSVSGATMEPTHSRIAATSLNVDQIRELQRLLTDRGYSAGTADGIIGPRTTAAIRQFQTANELTVNGKPDQATLRVLAPDAKKQEFFGLAPAYGEPGVREQPVRTEPVERMEQPVNKEPGKMMEQPMKKGY